MNRKRILTFALTLLLAFLLTACGEASIKVEETQASLQTEAEADAVIQIVFEYQDGHVNGEFENALEALFAVDIVMDMNISTNPYLRLKEELTHDMAPDMVLCEYIRQIEDDVQAKYFYDM